MDEQHARTSAPTPPTAPPTSPARDLDRRLGPLRSAAFGGLSTAIVLVLLAALWLQHDEDTGSTSWGPVVCFVLAVGALGWGGVAALVFWGLRAVLAGRPRRDG